MEVVATAMDPLARCSLWYVLSVAKTPKYPLNHAMTGRFTVTIATVK